MNHEEFNQTRTGAKDPAPGTARTLGKPVLAKPQELDRQRGQKIQEHLRTVLQSVDTLQACMGPILCDILEMCQVLRSALNEKISRAPSAVAGVKESMPLVQVYLQTIRQAERLANLDCRIRESRSARQEEEAA